MYRASAAQLKLVDEFASVMIRPLKANAGDPVMCKEWDLGAPDVRVTATPRAGADGTDQGQGFLGSRTVTMELQIMGDDPAKAGGHDPYWYAEKLTGFTHPSRSPVLEIIRNSESTAGEIWRLALRGNPYSITYTQRAAAVLELSLSFTAPLGLLEGPIRGPFTTTTSSGVATTDWRFPARFRKGFGTGGPLNPSVTMTVGGSSPISPVIYIAGPCINPKITTEDGEYFGFTGLSLSAGQVVQIDMDAGAIRTANVSTGEVDDSSSLFGAVDWAKSTFWRWNPGTHVLHFLSSGGSANVQYRERRLSI